jgi:hypothetical protein
MFAIGCLLWGATYALGLAAQNGETLTLERLCDESDLIVQAEVAVVYPPSARPTGRPGETDALLRISRTIKGATDISEVVVAQVQPMLEPGQQYIMFLSSAITPDRLAALPTRNGTPRYEVTYPLFSQFNVAGQKVHVGRVPVGASGGPRIDMAYWKRYEERSASEVIGEIVEHVRQNVSVPSRADRLRGSVVGGRR